jgi:hypothetical protein
MSSSSRKPQAPLSKCAEYKKAYLKYRAIQKEGNAFTCFL